MACSSKGGKKGGKSPAKKAPPMKAPPFTKKKGG